MSEASTTQRQNITSDCETGDCTHEPGRCPVEAEVYDNMEDPMFDDVLERFADPGGRSALRASSRLNPRNLPCPTCHAPNRLTPRDVALHYQCDVCADRDEGLVASAEY